MRCLEVLLSTYYAGIHDSQAEQHEGWPTLSGPRRGIGTFGAPPSVHEVAGRFHLAAEMINLVFSGETPTIFLDKLVSN